MTASVSDGSNSDSTLINVYVLDVNEAPEYTSSASFTADENQTSIGTVTVDEPDVGDTVTFSISGSEITINSSSGVLEFVSAPDYEVKSTYTATVTVTDGFNLLLKKLQLQLMMLVDGMMILLLVLRLIVRELELELVLQVLEQVQVLVLLVHNN